MENNRVCKLLGIRYPIIQGAMAWISDGILAGSVSKAGGLGVISGGGKTSELLREHIRQAKAITSKPFGVNLLMLLPNVEEHVDICIEEGVPVVTTGAGNPAPYMKKLKDAGIIVIPVIPSVAIAKKMEGIGADALIAEGYEAGGHIGDISSMALLPQVVESVSIPVIGAGGVAKGSQILAMIALGAEGIQAGTLFLTANECPVHENYKDAVIRAKDRSSVVTGIFTGHPVRVLENRFAKKMLEKERSGVPTEEIESMGVGKLKLAVIDGDIDNGSVMAGQAAGMVNRKASVQEIVDELMREFEAAKKRLDSTMSKLKI